MTDDFRTTLRSFHLHGVLNDAEVEASWDGEVLAASDSLLARAELEVEVDRALIGLSRQRFPSTLEGPAHLVLLTLVRACDGVHIVKYERQAPAHCPTLAQATRDQGPRWEPGREQIDFRAGNAKQD